MKKFISIILAVITVSVLCFVFASAESSTLIPKGATWNYVDHGGCRVDVKHEGSKVVISGSVADTWPSATAYYSKPITVDVNDAVINYDFTVSGGHTNITFIFTSPDKASEFSFPISNNALNSDNYESGSGDLLDGRFTGKIKVSDLTKATTNFDPKPFDRSYITSDGKVTFAGIQVYSCGGATITVDKLEVTYTSANGGNGSTEQPEDSSEAEGGEDESNGDETTVESSEAGDDEDSGKVDDNTSVESKTESDAEDKASEADESKVEEAKKGLSTGVIIAICAAVVVIAVVVIVVCTKKKK